MRYSRPLFALLAAGALASAATAQPYRVTVDAAPADRAAQVVAVTLPPAARALRSARGGDGQVLPLQVAADGTAKFIVPAQAAGTALVFTLGPDEAPGAGGVAVTREKGTLTLAVGGKPAAVYRMDKNDLPRPDIKPEHHRAGYLHPIFTPSGTVVTDDYPVQHVHHHGIWSPWTRTEFQGRKTDFWNTGAKTGTVEFLAVDWTWSGPVHGGFVARHRMIDISVPTPVAALHETWEVTVYALPAAAGAAKLQVFDLLLTQVCATNDPLILPQYHYGGLGVRGRGEWFGADKAKFFTSDGETDRVKANAKPMRWVHISGAVAGGTAGIAVLGHPDNFRAPQPVRVHPREPYVSFTPSQGGDWKIEPGKPYVARYRFVAADGPPDRAQLDALWHGFATPARLTMEAK